MAPTWPRPTSPRRYLFCSNCQNNGHQFVFCPRSTCGECKERGHISRVCPLRTCYNCGTSGHIAIDCNKTRSVRHGICWSCFEWGHIRYSRECKGNPNPDNFFCSYCFRRGTSTVDCECNEVVAGNPSRSRSYGYDRQQ